MKTCLIIIVLGVIETAGALELPALKQEFSSARASTEGDRLIVSTGKVERRWLWTGAGFCTETVTDTGKTAIMISAGGEADWNLGDLGKGNLVSLKAYKSNDDGFTSDHLAVEAEIHYAKLQLKYTIWAYPGAPGLRTQVWIQSKENIKDFTPGVSEILKTAHAPEQVTVWGYRAGLKANAKLYEVLVTRKLGVKDEQRKFSGLKADLGDKQVLLVKESHAHTDMPGEGCEIGGFRRDDAVMQTFGLGLLPKDVVDVSRFCWANWMIIGNGSKEEDAHMALKQFDRFRYPVNPDRDVFIMANTWGSEDMVAQCKFKAREENVLREIETCAKLGLDLLQIDDGWQDSNWSPRPSASPQKKQGALTSDEASGHHILLNGNPVPPTYAVYPNGFGRVRQAAKDAGIKLGLWHAWTAPTEAIKKNMDDGDFKAIKLDFADLGNRRALDSLYSKGREIVKYSKYSAVVNWDVTEKAPRMGFYFGRDCGNLYLENRKAATVRDTVLYNPWHILRDGWLLSQYLNLNKTQLTFQNKDHVPVNGKSDAPKYPHDYNLVLTLMSSPIFFMETQFLSEEAVKILKPIIQTYKSERDSMYKGYVFPIGSMPDNGSWTGFQNHNNESTIGYLSVFRELNNQEPEAKMKLLFLKPGTTLSVTDLISGKKSKLTLNDKCEATFSIPKAPGFQFLKYEH